MDKADIIIEDGKIVQVGAELEVPSGMHYVLFTWFWSHFKMSKNVLWDGIGLKD